MPWGTPEQCQWMCLIIRNNNIYGFGVWFWTISEILILRLIWTWCGASSSETPSRCNWMCHHKEQKYLCFRGGDLSGFWDIRPFLKWRGRGIARGNPRSVSMNVSYHMEKDIWFRDGVLNGFWDIKTCMNWRGGTYLYGMPRSVSLNVFYHKE